MDEYTLEIRELDRRIAALKSAPDGGDPALLAELEDERNILKTLYSAALEFLERGDQDPRLAADLEPLGFSPWGLKAAYDFVYELMEELPVPHAGRTSELLRGIRSLDPAAEVSARLAKRELSWAPHRQAQPPEV
jgi:hypothetical protein